MSDPFADEHTIQRVHRGISHRLRSTSPRRAISSSGIAIIAITFATTAFLLGGHVASVGVVAGIALALVSVTLASDRPGVRAIGGALAVPVSLFIAVPVLVAIGIGAELGGFGFLVSVTIWATIVASVAGVLCPWKRFGDGGVRSAAIAGLFAIMGVLGVIIFRALPDGSVRDVMLPGGHRLLSTAATPFVGGGGSWAVVTFGALAVLTIITVGWTVDAVPFDRLFPPGRREAARTVMAVIAHRSRSATAIALVVVVMLLTLPIVMGRPGDVPASPSFLASNLPWPIGVTLATVVSAMAIRIAMTVALVGCLLAVLTVRLRDARPDTLAPTVAGWLAPTSGGAVGAIVIATAVRARAPERLDTLHDAPIGGFIESLPLFVVTLVLVLLALSSMVAILAGISGLSAIRILPRHAPAAALGCGAIATLAMIAIIVGRVEVGILVTAGAFFLWQVGTTGTIRRVELPQSTDSRRLAVVHASATAAVSLLLALATIGIGRVLRWWTPSTDPTTATAIVLLGLAVTAATILELLRTTG